MAFSFNIRAECCLSRCRAADGFPTSSPVSARAAFFSIYWQSKFFILAFPFLGYSASVYFSDVMFKNIPQADISQCFNPSYNIWNSKILSILYPICFAVIFISIIIFLTSNILRRRYYENVRK